MTSREFAILSQLIKELKEEVRDIKHGVHDKIDTVAKAVKDAFEGFGILDPDEDTWTEAQICERYHVSPRTLYTYCKEGKLKPVKTGKGKTCKKRYPKADVMELFASRNA